MPNNQLENLIDRTTLETWFLSKLLLDTNFSKVIAKEFDKRWLKNSENAVIAKILINFSNKYDRAISINELGIILKGVVNKNNTDLTIEYVSNLLPQLTNIIKYVSADVLTDNVSDFIKKQAAWCAIIDSVNDIEKDPDTTVAKCLNKLNNVLTLELTTPDVGFDYFVEVEYNEHFEYLLRPENKISTGWQSLDALTHGGFLCDGKSLYLVIGQPGLGKSVFLSNFAVNFLKQNKAVVVISLEMSEHIYAQRFDAHISAIDINELGQNENTIKTRIKNFKNLYPGARLFIKEYPPRTVSAINIERYLTELMSIKGIKPDVIIIDYLNLVNSTFSDSDNMFKAGLDVSERLRALSYKFEAPVVTACQVNTEGMNTDKVDIQNISESRGIAHTADFIMGLFQTDADRQNANISTRILKNRLGGRVGKVVPFNLNPSTLVLTDVGGASISNTTVKPIDDADDSANIPDNISDILDI